MITLVTGATGLIGSHLVRALRARGHTVRALVRDAATEPCRPGTPAASETVVGDVREPGDVSEALAGCDTVFHTAVPFAYGEQVDDDVVATATEGTENVLRAAAANSVRRVVVTSSSVVFGHSATPVVLDELADGPTRLATEPGYVRAKLQQDRRASELAADLDLDVVLTCPTVTVGPVTRALGPGNAIVLQYLSDPMRSTYDGGINIVGADDVAAGHLSVAARGRRGAHYLLGGENLTWREVHATIADLCGVARPGFTAPPAATFLAAAAEELRARLRRRPPVVTRDQASMTGRYYWYSSSRAAGLGYAAAPARDALARTISWLVASEHVSRDARAGMTLHRDVYAARAAERRTDLPYEEAR